MTSTKNSFNTVWENIEAQLNKKKKKHRVIPIWWRYAGAAAILLLLLTIGNNLYKIQQKLFLKQDFN